MIFSFIKKVFGTAQGRQLKKFQKIVKQINVIEEEYQSFSEEKLKATVTELKKELSKGKTLDEILPSAYALIKNVCRRLIGKEIYVSGYNQKWDMIPYDVQILGAIAMHHGAIAEMQTGEGKTLTASMPLFLNALTEKPVHLVTVNDYLAKRDCEWVGTIFRYLGLKVAALTNETSPDDRKKIYAADIVYGTASEFGFDYLRDNSMAHSAEEQCQRGFYFAIIDEVDSILIDEARTPLIISGPAPNSRQMYDILKTTVSRLVCLQRNFCHKLASKAHKTLEDLGRLGEEGPLEKLSKKDEKKETQALKDLWLVGKGTPQNKILKRVKEHPDLRARLEKWETYFYADPNKEERYETLSKLYIIIDERSSDFELTDQGIQAWSGEKKEAKNDFVMLDLGHEYALIDQDSTLSKEDKLDKKISIREEDSRRKERAHNLRQLMRAHLLMEKDVDYIIENKKIVIIDENTGRPQPGRRFSDGLHQAIEAKEGVPIQQETQTYATVTLQNYFRMYDKLAGMTGTAMTEAHEFKEIYKIDVLEIPTHRPCIRKDFDDEIYMSEREKYYAIIKYILKIYEKGCPILIGTESVEISEKLSRILKQNKLPHTVLNAKNHAKEAEIIAQAGKKNAITVATNMAGRGTDIKLEEGIAEKGGLHVIGTTRHQSRRIDRQLIGRTARQGDPGSSKFYTSFEDSLMRLFASPKLTTFLQRFRPPEGEPISANVLNRSIETAQKRVEQRNYSIRKHTLEYDDVMNKQRREVYSFRNELLHHEDLIQLVNEILENICSQIAEEFFVSRSIEGGWDSKGYANYLMTHFPVTFEEDAFESDYQGIEEIETKAAKKIVMALSCKLEMEAQTVAAIQEQSGQEIDPQPILEGILRGLLIRNTDRLWQEHLLLIDHLRTEVGMRVVGQKDPLLEFKQEAFVFFDRFSKDLKLKITHSLFNFEMAPPQKNKNSHLAQLKKMGPTQPHSFFISDPKSGLYLPSAPIKTKKSN